MHFFHAIAGFVLFFELPIPIYWLILHPFHSFWRARIGAAFWFAGLTAWTCGGVALWNFRHALLAQQRVSYLGLCAGFALIALEIYLFTRVERELGSKRLVGHAELTGGGEMFSGGLYSHVRHPRYTGMFSAAIGAALIAGSKILWIVLIIWWPVALLAIYLEERELSSRFGSSYLTYRQRVPAFLPFRLRPVRKT